MVQTAIVALCLGMVAMVAGSAYNVDPDIYDDLLMQEMYRKLALMNEPELRAPAIPDYYFDEDDTIQIPKDMYIDSHENGIESRDSASADIRDQEMIEHSSHGDGMGFQYISGGAGEGEQHLTPEGKLDNPEEVKTDEHLPFYCHPPNPCPKGFTAEDGCDDFVDDSAEFARKWIWKMQSRGMCACDEEHMFHCPKENNRINSDKGNMEKDDLDQVLENLLEGKDKGIEDIDEALEKMQNTQKRSDNPYLGGNKLSRPAKKGIGYN